MTRRDAAGLNNRDLGIRKDRYRISEVGGRRSGKDRGQRSEVRGQIQGLRDLGLPASTERSDKGWGLRGLKLLEVKNITVTFETDEGVVKAIDDVSFHIDRNEIVGLVGE